MPSWSQFQKTERTGIKLPMSCLAPKGVPWREAPTHHGSSRCPWCEAWFPAAQPGPPDWLHWPMAGAGPTTKKTSHRSLNRRAFLSWNAKTPHLTPPSSTKTFPKQPGREPFESSFGAWLKSWIGSCLILMDWNCRLNILKIHWLYFLWIPLSSLYSNNNVQSTIFLQSACMALEQLLLLPLYT